MSAYDYGYDSYWDGKDISQNPFYKEDDEWEDWNNGWICANDDSANE